MNMIKTISVDYTVRIIFSKVKQKTATPNIMGKRIFIIKQK